MDKVREFTKDQLKNKVDFKVGDTVRVHQKIKEGDKERVQVFEGLVIAKKHGSGISGTFTVRKVTSGVGVEKVFPTHAPFIDKIEIVKSGKVRSSKIYYIRDATGRRGRLKEIKRKVKEVVDEIKDKLKPEDKKDDKDTKEDDQKITEDVKKEEDKSADKKEEKKEEAK